MKGSPSRFRATMVVRAVACAGGRTSALAALLAACLACLACIACIERELITDGSRPFDDAAPAPGSDSAPGTDAAVVVLPVTCGGPEPIPEIGTTCAPCRTIACAGASATRCAYTPGPGCPAFTEVTTAAGLTLPLFSHVQDSGPGMAVADFDGDGVLDILHAGGPHPYLFLGDAFAEASYTLASTALDFLLAGNGAVPVDLDGDADLDLVMTGFPAATDLSVWRNTAGALGDASSTWNASLDRGGNGLAFADYDADGDLDLFVATFVQNDESHLLRNDGGTFTDVTFEAGVDMYGARSFQPVWLDYDMDGDPDLLVANDIPWVTDVTSKLFANEGDGTFTDVSAIAGVDYAIDGMGIAVGDPDLDGDPDVYITNVAGVPVKGMNNILLMNEAGVFTEESIARGADQFRWAWGTMFLDYDNDGDEDLFYATEPRGLIPGGCVLLNNDGTGNFTDVSGDAHVAIDTPTFGALAVDVDADGDLDLLLSGRRNSPPLRLLLNNGNTGRWLAVTLDEPGLNRHGIGATIRVTAGGVVQTRWMRAGESIHSGGPPIVHFGLGWSPNADLVEVIWPDGAVTTLTEVEIDQTLTVLR